MRETVSAFLDTLDPSQRAEATYPFGDAERFRWTYLPGPRGGVALAELTENQRNAALAMLDAALSSRGARTAREIMALESVLREIEERSGADGSDGRDPQLYWFSVFGRPGEEAAWAWRVGGHHLCLHITVVGSDVAVTPLFFGAHPAQVSFGEDAGKRPLADEEDVARELLHSLDEEQRALAVVSDVAPSDILTGSQVRAEISRAPRGITAEQLDAGQRRILARLLGVYTGRIDGPSGVRLDDEPKLSFAWAGGEQPGEGHYYALRTDSTLIEYDNTQHGANHVHTVWRDMRSDWGEDLLAAHYRDGHSG